MTIVVTGGAGFIGSNFIFHLLETHSDYRIICLDKLTYAGNLSTLKSVMDNPRFRFVKLDICDREDVYNIGGHNEMRNIDIVKLICKELGKPESLVTYVTDRKGHDIRYAIDSTKIRNELGWLPETNFKVGIKKTIKWYLEHRDWWEGCLAEGVPVNLNGTIRFGRG